MNYPAHGQPRQPARSRRPKVLAFSVLGAVAVVMLAVGLWAFQPWKAFTSSTIDEPLPGVAAEDPTGADQSGAGDPTEQAGQGEQGEQLPELTVLAEGTFVTQEHDTSGTAKVLELADGSRVLRLEGFATSDGPDVHVWLTDQEAGGDMDKYDDGDVVKLGKLKATNGNQNYQIPAGAELAGLRSAVIWCDRFDVAFGSAALTR